MYRVDCSALVCSVAMLATLITEASFPGRPVLALVFVLGVPGWTAIRLAGGPVSVLTGVFAIALSISIAMISSIVVVASSSWGWRPLAAVTAAACVAGLVEVILFTDDATAMPESITSSRDD